jgi:microcystin-dependent protein
VVGAGSSYSPGNTGGADTVTLTTAQLPIHTHSISGSGNTGNNNVGHFHGVSINSGDNNVGHTHTGSGSTGDANVDHIHSGATASQNRNHIHGINFNTSTASNNHSHGVNDPGHTHTQDGNIGDFFLYSGGGGNPGIGQPLQANVNVSSSFTGISIAEDGAFHVHLVSGNTGGQSENHEHAFSTGGMSANAAHAHSFGFTTSTQSANHIHNVSGNTGTQSANHIHAFSFSGTSGPEGNGAAHENRPPYYALAYIMKS